MKRLIALTLLKLCAEALLITFVATVIVGWLGYKFQWGSIKYANAFFIAGVLVFVAGASSRLGASQDWSNALLISGESFRGMSSSERADFIVNASSSFRLVILGFLSGVFLTLLSVLASKIL